MRTRWTLAVLVLLALVPLSCATTGLTPDAESVPAARLALPDEQRVFFDALQGYGDWLLIEPLGYVFRPCDSTEYWHPYLYGYWAPSDFYGWVWVSSEPYGWATYHYGVWYYDDYQGWVWIPGSDWGPAWVSWVATPDYVGWAPLFPPGYSADLVPGGGYLYVPISALAATDLPRQVRTRSQLGVLLGVPVQLSNLHERGGVTFNAGPPFDMIERRDGPLRRVQLEDLAVTATAGSGDVRRATGPLSPTVVPPTEGPGAGRRGAVTPGAAAGESVRAMRRTGEAAAQRARSVVERGAPPPPSVGILRPDLRRGAAREAASDSTRRR